MSTSTYLRKRIDSRPLTGLLAVGDALALIAFVTAGTIQHGGQPLSRPGAVAGTLAPFLLAWVVVALLGGLYTTDAVRSPRATLRRTVPAWVVAVLLGQTLRVTPAFAGGTSVAFILVTLVVGGLLLVGWRVLFVFGRKMAE